MASAIKPWPQTLAEVQAEVDTLKSLLHYKTDSDFQEYPKYYLETILTKGANFTASGGLHTGLSVP